jgi:hypothetical protein
LWDGWDGGLDSFRSRKTIEEMIHKALARGQRVDVRICLGDYRGKREHGLSPANDAPYLQFGSALPEDMLVVFRLSAPRGT